MNQFETVPEGVQIERTNEADTRGVLAMTCGAVGAAASVWAYWLVIPGLVLGVAALVLGVQSLRRGGGAVAGAAIALGIAAVLLVPSVLFVVDDAEDWGRNCVLNPSNPDC